jgi:hypothetical protein
MRWLGDHGTADLSAVTSSSPRGLRRYDALSRLFPAAFGSRVEPEWRQYGGPVTSHGDIHLARRSLGVERAPRGRIVGACCPLFARVGASPPRVGLHEPVDPRLQSSGFRPALQRGLAKRSGPALAPRIRVARRGLPGSGCVDRKETGDRRAPTANERPSSVSARTGRRLRRTGRATSTYARSPHKGRRLLRLAAQEGARSCAVAVSRARSRVRAVRAPTSADRSSSYGFRRPGPRLLDAV